jgi:hypothetical protein
MRPQNRERNRVQPPAALSVEECRRLLGPASERIADTEVERIREMLYALAALIVEGFEGQGVTDRSVSNREKS